MAKQKTEMTETDRKIAELKVEMLKQVTKRRSIKKEVARLLTMKNQKTKLPEKKPEGAK